MTGWQLAKTSIDEEQVCQSPADGLPPAATPLFSTVQIRRDLANAAQLSRQATSRNIPRSGYRSNSERGSRHEDQLVGQGTLFAGQHAPSGRRKRRERLPKLGDTHCPLCSEHKKG